ncbi:glutamate-rich 3-like [Pelobates cultripes]|uniref:Glutamate-rich 3-like n=1 Tax=Pelobates cultripes TaxID=61616 RepID=A0AAD1T329_PELCU|nr:glutamate-rich 3-like [Pelobates cultripes]
MNTSLDTNSEFLNNCLWDASMWLTHKGRRDIRPLSHFPQVSLKCTSMILDTVNFSIDYSSPFIPSAFKSLHNTEVSGNDQDLQSIKKSDKRRAQEHTNVHLTMQYLGTGFSVTSEIVNPKDEVRMFQQACGGENLCVYKGYLSAGETFQFLSKRQHGFPFSASVYINGLIVTRLSSCCEYRYHAGFQQGKRGCFRVTQISGGTPCYRCTDFHKRKQIQIKPKEMGNECQGLAKRSENVFRENQLKDCAQGSGHLMPSNIEDSAINTWNIRKPYLGSEIPGGIPHQQPNLRPIQVNTANQRRRRKKKRAPKQESDSEQENIQRINDRRSRKSKTCRPETRDHRRSSKTRSLSGCRESNNETKYVQSGGAKERFIIPSEEDFATVRGDGTDQIQCNRNPAYILSDECKLPRKPPGGCMDNLMEDEKAINQENTDPTSLRKSSIEYRPIHTKLEAALAGGDAPCSEVELSDSSDSSENRSTVALEIADCQISNTERADIALPVTDLQEAAKTHVNEENVSEFKGPEIGLETPEGEEERNSLVSQISALSSVLQDCDEVNELILRNTGMTDSLLHLLTTAIVNSKSQVESVNLNLNEIGPEGAKTIVQLLKEKPCVKSLLLYGNKFGDPGIKELMSSLSMLNNSKWGITPNIQHLELTELDIGGNQLSTEGLRSVAFFLKLNPTVKYLGLAKISVNGWEVWKELFDAMRDNTNINHVLLDENNLGDRGATLLAQTLQINQSLVKIDLDSNGIGDRGGQAIAESLTSNMCSAVKCISLEDNPISTEMMDKIQTLLENKQICLIPT